MSTSETQIPALPSSGGRPSHPSSSSSAASISNTSIPSVVEQQNGIPIPPTNIPEEAVSGTVTASTSDTPQASRNSQVPTEENTKSIDLQEPTVPEKNVSVEEPSGVESSEVGGEDQEIKEGPKFIQPDHL